MVLLEPERMKDYRSHLPHTFTSLMGSWHKTLPPMFYKVWDFLPYLPWNKSCRIIQTKLLSCGLELGPHNWPWSHPVPSVSCSSFIFFLRFLYLAVVSLHCYTRAFSSGSEQWLLFAVLSRLLLLQAWALGTWVSVAVAPWAGGIFPQPETEPMPPVLQGRYLTTGQPGKLPLLSFLMYGTKMIGI